MLIRRAILEQIQAGTVTLAFRRWRRPTVKAGGTLKTSLGVLQIHSVDKLSGESKITAAEARQAGYPDRQTLLRDLGQRDGELYRISLAYGGDDPRIRLREKADLSEAELAQILGRLQKLDAASREGPWTQRVLMQIRDYPHQHALTLATNLGLERAWFKAQVRKLKNLGLTISHRPGYALSPRGQAVLQRLNNNG